MPEMPEVQGLVDFLDERLDGLAVESLELASFSVLKTFDLPPQALAGAPVDGVHRHGKFIDVDCDGIHLVVHLARAGWIRWSDELPRTVLRPGKSPIALRVRLVDGSGFDVTEAGTKKSLAAYLVRDEQVHTLYAALRSTLSDAVAAASGKPAKELKDAKRAGMRVHGRTGEACPECGDVVREVSFADRSLQYCATCQTGGTPLADRRTSKFLK